MKNLEQIKESLTKNQETEEAINNPQTLKKPKIPLQRDIDLIERTLHNKLKDKESEIKDKLLSKTNQKYALKIKELHQKAITLKQEFIKLNKEIKTQTKIIQIDLNDYSSYIRSLPHNLTEILQQEILKLTEKLPEINKMEEEIEDFMLDIKLGLTPLSDIKPLLDKINNLK